MNLRSQRVGEKSLQNRYSTRDSYNSVGRQTIRYKKIGKRIEETFTKEYTQIANKDMILNRNAH